MMSAMDFRHELSYDAPPGQVFEMLADPAFREKVCRAMDVVSVEVSLDRSGAGFTLVCDQVQKTTGLPSFARKFAGDTTRAVQKETWPDASGGSLQIETPGKPTSMTGTIRLDPDGAGTTEVVELEIKAKVPLIGGKLEGLMAEQVRAGMDTEHQVGTAWLTGER
jgi:uncharacterized protein YndB with AHSA1/START domain